LTKDALIVGIASFMFKAEPSLEKLQTAIKVLRLKTDGAPTTSVKNLTNILARSNIYLAVWMKQFPRKNMITTIWLGFIGTGLVDSSDRFGC